MDRAARMRGALVGQALGDAIGLAMRGLTRDAIAALPEGGGGPWLGGAGGEVALVVARALVAEPVFVTGFSRRLRRSLAWWLWSAPPGQDGTTAAALKRGPSPIDAGAAPALRAPAIGLRFCDEDDERRAAFAAAAARLTHGHAHAVAGALIVAETAAWIAREGDDPDELALRLRRLFDDRAWRERLDVVFAATARGLSVGTVASRMGLGQRVPTDALDVVPLALAAFLRRRGRPTAAIISATACGGETALVAGLAGALAGADAGDAGWPGEWLARWRDRGRLGGRLRAVGDQLGRARDVALPLPRAWWPLALPRNLARRAAFAVRRRAH